MKKAIFSFIIPAVALSMALVAFVPAPAAKAQVAACPVGFTCTPVAPQPVNCPTGFVCTPTTSGGGSSSGSGGGVTSTTDATVTVNGSPSLALSYDSAHKESALTATFNLTVTAGHSDLYLYTGIAGASLLDTKGNSAPGAVSVGVAAGEKNNQYGDYTQVVAGGSVQMTVTVTGNPKQMFAGSYHGFISNLYVFGPDTSPTPLSAPSNHTNEVVIVGEVSPYITFVTPNIVSPGQTLTLQGVRFTSPNAVVNVLVDGSLLNVGFTAPTGGQSIIFSVPSLAVGYHSVQVSNSITGNSNAVSFQVQSSSPVTSCYVFSSNLTIGSTGADVVALQTWLIANGFDIPAISSGRQQKGVYSFQTAAAVARYQASIGIQATGYFGPATRAALNASCTNPSPTPISSAGIVASLDPSSPLTSTIQISSSAVTYNVPLAVFDLKSQGQSANLQSLTLALYTNGKGGLTANQLFSNLQIKVSGQTFTGQAIEAKGYGNLAYFKNITVPLPADQNVPVTVYATVAANSNGTLDSATAQVSLVPSTSNIVALDSNYNTVPVASSGTISGSTITFSSAAGGAQVSNTSATLGPATSCSTTSSNCMQYATFTFSLTAGNAPVYIAKVNAPATSCPAGFTCSTIGPLTFAGAVVTANISTNSFAGDGSTYYIIPSGATRQFTVSAQISNSGLSAGMYPVKITSIQYGTDTSNMNSNSITSGLDNLTVTVTFNGGGTTPVTPPSTLQYNSSDQVITFTKNFNVSQTSQPIMLDIAADNRYSVLVNGITMGVSNNDYSFSSPSVYDITSAVHAGSNSISIKVVNVWQPDPMNGYAWQYNPGGLDYKIISGGTTLASSDGTEQSSYNGVRSATVIPLSALGSWTTIPGASWIWDSSLYNQYSATQQPTITVTSPNGGETFSAGSSVSINWKTNISTQTVNIWLSDKYGNTVQPIVSPLTNLGTLSSVGSYSWTIPKDIVSAGTTGAYKIFINTSDSSGKVFSDYSDNYFTIISPTQTSQPPVISGGTFPTTLTVSQTGTWSVSAYDPQNGSLSYMVDWGDQNQKGMTSASTAYFTQSSSFTHQYSSAGTYTVTFTVKNVAGLSAQTSTTVNVTAPACPAGYVCTPPSQTYSCPAGYTCTNQTANCPSGYTCSTQAQSTVTVNATVTYSCPSGYTLNSDNTCSFISNPSPSAGATSPGAIGPGSAGATPFAPQPTTVNATPNYSCPSGYTLSGTTCTGPTSYSGQTSLTGAIWDAVRQYLNAH